jgi:hypothetical protein
MEKVGEEISDGSVLNLIKLFLKSGVMDNGSFYLNDRGSPQGGLCKALHRPPYAKKNKMQSKHHKAYTYRLFVSFTLHIIQDVYNSDSQERSA